MGRVLHSNVVCADIIDHITTDMRRNLLQAIVVDHSPISILIDESTSLGQLSCLVIYLRYAVADALQPATLFLDIVELKDATTVSIVSALLACLESHG